MSKSIIAYDIRGPFEMLPPAEPTEVGVPGICVSGGVGHTISDLGVFDTGVAGAVETKCVFGAGVAAGVVVSKSSKI